MNFEIIKPVILALISSLILIILKYNSQKSWEKDEIDMIGCCFVMGIYDYLIEFLIIFLVLSISYLLIWNIIQPCTKMTPIIVQGTF